MAQTHSIDFERGSTQYANIAHASTTGIHNLGSTWTYEAWIKLESLPSSGQAYGIISGFSNSDEGQPDLFYCNESGTLRFQVYTQGATSRLNMTLIVDRWYHVAFTFSSGTVWYYIDGLQTAVTSGTTGTPAASTDNFQIGRGGHALEGASGSAGCFDGMIKDARVFTDVRTPAEIAADAGTETVSDGNLVGEWNFNNSANDSSGNGNNLTLVNSPSYSTTIPWEDAVDVDGSTYLETSLIAWWDMDETSGTRNDSHGVNHLTDNNTVGSAAGKISNAADFEAGNSEYLSIADNAALSPTGSMTISSWINFETVPGGAQTIIGKIGDATAPNYAYRLYIEPPTDGLYFNLKNSAGTDGSKNYNWSPSAGVWYHIVAVFDATNSLVSFYINGALVSRQSTAISDLRDTPSQFEIGATSNFGNYFDGLIDETAMWSRALHYGDVLDLYNGGTGITYDATVPSTGVTGRLMMMGMGR